MDPPSSAEKKSPLQKNGQKAAAVISPVFFFPTQKGQNFRPDLQESERDKGNFLPSECFSCERICRFPIEML